jgi:glycosyltransferase involved in cell wall biosynthesis
MLRILTIGHSYVVRLNRTVPAALAAMPGVEMTIAAPANFEGDLRSMTLEGTQGTEPYRLVPLRTRLSQRIHLFSYENRALFRLIREGHFDIVHAWEEPYVLAGYQIVRAVGPTRTRFSFRTAQSLVKRYPPPFTFFEKQAFARAQGWVAGGRLVYDAMVKKGLPPGLGRILTLAVDMQHFQPLPEPERDRVRAELGLAGQGPVVGYLGRLVPDKGLHMLMQSLEQVRAPWSFLALGSGPMKADLERWAAEKGWSERVKVLLVKHDEVPRYLNAMHLLVAPSLTMPNWKEQFGRMIIEAFACGVPVVGSDSGEIPFVIDTAGVVAREGDVKAWTEAIEGLLTDPARRAALGQAGLERCRAKYSNEGVARGYLEFFQKMMEVPLPR